MKKTDMKKTDMTVNRYLRLIAGALIMVSVALGLLVNVWWLAFTAFIGLNLFQSAFTNWCPMMSLLNHLGVPDQPTELPRPTL